MQKVNNENRGYGNLATNESESASDARNVNATPESLDSAKDVSAHETSISSPRLKVPRVDGVVYSRRGRIKIAEVKQTEDVSFDHVSKVVLSQLVFSLVKKGDISSEQAKELTQTPLWTNIIIFGLDQDPVCSLVRRVLHKRAGKHSRSIASYLYARYRSLTKDDARSKAVKKMLATMHSKKLTSAKNRLAKMHRKVSYAAKDFTPQGWEFVAKAAKKIADFCDPVASAIKDLVSKATTAIAALFSRAKDAVKSVINDLTATFAKYRDLLIKKVKETFETIVSTLLPASLAAALVACVAVPIVGLLYLHITAMAKFRESLHKGDMSVFWGMIWLITSVLVGPIWIIEVIYITRPAKADGDVEFQGFEDIFEEFVPTTKAVFSDTIKFISGIAEGTSKLLLADRFVDLVVKYFKFSYLVACGHSWDDRLFIPILEEIKKFSEDAQTAIDNFKSKPTIDTAKSIIALDKAGIELERKTLARKVPPVRLVAFSEVRSRLSIELISAKKYVISTGTIPKPVGILIYGLPGTGKDTLVDLICRLYDFPSKLVWPIEEDFVESFADQKTIVVQDFGQNTDKQLLTKHMNVIRTLIENTPQPVARAFGDKGTSFSSPEYVFVTTNHIHPLTDAVCHMKDVGAFYRRFEIIAEVIGDKTRVDSMNSDYQIQLQQIVGGAYHPIGGKLAIEDFAYIIKHFRKLSVQKWESTEKVSPPKLKNIDPTLDHLASEILKHRGTGTIVKPVPAVESSDSEGEEPILRKKKIPRYESSSGSDVDLQQKEFPDMIARLTHQFYVLYIEGKPLQVLRRFISEELSYDDPYFITFKEIAETLVNKTDFTKDRQEEFVKITRHFTAFQKSFFTHIDIVTIQGKTGPIFTTDLSPASIGTEFQQRFLAGEDLDHLVEWLDDISCETIRHPLPYRIVFEFCMFCYFNQRLNPGHTRLRVMEDMIKYFNDHSQDLYDFMVADNAAHGIHFRAGTLGNDMSDYVSDSESEDTDSDSDVEYQYFGLSSVPYPDRFVTITLHGDKKVKIDSEVFALSIQQCTVKDCIVEAFINAMMDFEIEHRDLAKQAITEFGARDLIAQARAEAILKDVGEPHKVLSAAFWKGDKELDYYDYVSLSKIADENTEKYYEFYAKLWDALKSVSIIIGLAALSALVHYMWPKQEIKVESEDWKRKRETRPTGKRNVMKMKKLGDTPAVTPQALSANVLNKVSSQMFDMEVFLPNHGPRMVKCLFVTDRLILCVSHVMRENMSNILSPLIRPDLIKIKMKNLLAVADFDIIDTENDCLFVRLKTPVPGIQDISNHFLSNEVELTDDVPVVLVLVSDNLIKTSKVTGIKTASIPAWPVAGSKIN